jgi:hypothetical protein
MMREKVQAAEYVVRSWRRGSLAGKLNWFVCADASLAGGPHA